MKLSANTDELTDLLATKLAEVRLSELGYNLIPGIAPYFTRNRFVIEARGAIVKANTLITNDATQERSSK